MYIKSYLLPIYIKSFFQSVENPHNRKIIGVFFMKSTDFKQYLSIYSSILCISAIVLVSYT